MSQSTALARQLADLHGAPPSGAAYQAGRDAGLHGPTTTNCHVRYFSSRELTAEWERGKRDGERARNLKRRRVRRRRQTPQ